MTKRKRGKADFQLTLFPGETKPKAGSIKQPNYDDKGYGQPTLLQEAKTSDDYKKMPIKDIFNKKLLITSITIDYYEPKDQEEPIPFILVYAEDESAEGEDRYIQFRSSGRVLLDQAEKINQLPVRGMFIENPSYSGRKYHLFVRDGGGKNGIGTDEGQEGRNNH